jgi:hypothetical protein
MKLPHYLLALVLLSGTAFAGMAVAQEVDNGSADQPEATTTESDVDAPTASGTFTAAVNNNGSLQRGQGVRNSRRLSQGVYEVIFNSNVRQCVRVASIGLPNTGDPPPGVISTAARNGNNRGVFIRTGTTNGASSNRPFQLIVICP